MGKQTLWLPRGRGKGRKREREWDELEV